MIDSIGMEYDLKNIVDLARYLVPTPPVPTRWRRGMLALGSGDPTRVICSTRIAEAFQSIAYPILPRIECETLHIRHHSLFTPRDFDVSPYFRVIKPTIEKGFDFRPDFAREKHRVTRCIARVRVDRARARPVRGDECRENRVDQM